MVSQRGSVRTRPADRREGWVLRRCGATLTQHFRRPVAPYGVHMRSTPSPRRDTWAAFIKVARERAGVNKTELGRRIGRDRNTVQRWEDGKHRPDDADLVARVAAALDLDLEEALAAAGMRPGVAPPAAPTPVDEEVELIMRSPVSDAMKRRMLARLEELREQDRQRRMEQISWILEQGA